MRERLEQEALAWIKTLVLQPAGFQLVNAERQVVNGQDLETALSNTASEIKDALINHDGGGPNRQATGHTAASTP